MTKLDKRRDAYNDAIEAAHDAAQAARTEALEYFRALTLDTYPHAWTVHLDRPDGDSLWPQVIFDRDGDVIAGAVSLDDVAKWDEYCSAGMEILSWADNEPESLYFEFHTARIGGGLQPVDPEAFGAVDPEAFGK